MKRKNKIKSTVNDLDIRIISVILQLLHTMTKMSHICHAYHSSTIICHIKGYKRFQNNNII